MLPLSLFVSELIIVNDCSRDKTGKIAEDLSLRALKCVHLMASVTPAWLLAGPMVSATGTAGPVGASWDTTAFT